MFHLISSFDDEHCIRRDDSWIQKISYQNPRKFEFSSLNMFCGKLLAGKNVFTASSSLKKTHKGYRKRIFLLHILSGSFYKVSEAVCIIRFDVFYPFFPVQNAMIINTKCKKHIREGFELLLGGYKLQKNTRRSTEKCKNINLSLLFQLL